MLGLTAGIEKQIAEAPDPSPFGTVVAVIGNMSPAVARGFATSVGDRCPLLAERSAADSAGVGPVDDALGVCNVRDMRGRWNGPGRVPAVESDTAARAKEVRSRRRVYLAPVGVCISTQRCE